jgi:hypothetical protein
MSWREQARRDLAGTPLPDWLADGILTVARDAGHAYEIAGDWLLVMRECEASAERIRAQVAAAECYCEYPGPIEDGRCSKCVGTRETT